MAGRQVGECAVTHLGGGTVHIELADPKIIVSAEILDRIRQGDSPCATLDGDILRIHGTNRTVIYHIGERVPDLLAYYAEWPD